MMLKNSISLILASKGSGKTILSNALALAQDKPVFVITPIKNGWALQKGDKLNIYDIKSLHKNDTYIFEIQIDKFDKLLSNIVKLKNICIVIDEVDIFTQRIQNKQSAFYELVNLGRHNQIDLIALSRRPCDMPTTLRAQSDILYLGRTGKEVNNKKYISEWLGGDYADWCENAEPFTFKRIVLSSNQSDSLIKLSENLVTSILKFYKRGHDEKND